MSFRPVQLELSSAPTLTGYLGNSSQIQESPCLVLGLHNGNWPPPLSLIHALFDFRDFRTGRNLSVVNCKNIPNSSHPSLDPCLW